MDIGLAILSAIVVFFFVKPLTTDGMIQEDQDVSLFFFLSLSLSLSLFRWHARPITIFSQFRRYLEEHGYDTSGMGFGDSTTSSVMEMKNGIPPFDKV